MAGRAPSGDCRWEPLISALPENQGVHPEFVRVVSIWTACGRFSRHNSGVQREWGPRVRIAWNVEAWRSGVRLCRGATWQGISRSPRPKCSSVALGPAKGASRPWRNSCQGRLSQNTIGHRSHASENLRRRSCRSSSLSSQHPDFPEEPVPFRHEHQ